MGEPEAEDSVSWARGGGSSTEEESTENVLSKEGCSQSDKVLMGSAHRGPRVSMHVLRVGVIPGFDFGLGEPHVSALADLFRASFQTRAAASSEVDAAALGQTREMLGVRGDPQVPRRST